MNVCIRVVLMRVVFCSYTSVKAVQVNLHIAL